MNLLCVTWGHTSSAAVMVDGVIVACSSEERYNGLKCWGGWPYNAINACLKMAGLEPRDIDRFIWSREQVVEPYEFLTHRYSQFSVDDFIREQEEFWRPKLYEGRQVDYLNLFSDKIDVNQFPGPEFLKPIVDAKTPLARTAAFEKVRDILPTLHLGISSEKIVSLNHHECHAAYAVSGMPGLRPGAKKLVFTLDGMGDGENATVSIFQNGRLQKLFGTAEFTLARLYRFVTLLLKMKILQHEYKVMGLAPYSKPYHSDKPYEVFSETMFIDGLQPNFKTRPQDYYFHFQEKLKACRFDGIAGGLQRYAEEIVCCWVNAWTRHTGIQDVAFSGGVAMNIKANMELAERLPFESLQVPGSGGDESLAIGGCYLFAMREGLPWEPLHSMYLGDDISEDAARAALRDVSRDSGFVVREDAGPSHLAAELARGRVIGRCVGKMEFGARALGNRSVLADPRRSETIRTINDKIKSRDFWMPFAPSILKCRASDYLRTKDGVDYSQMTVGAHSTDEGKKLLAACLHPADDTARPQVVSDAVNPEYATTIREFERLTGVGALLNSSFNIHGDPIVRTPSDAIHVLKNTDIDGVLIGRFLVLRNTAR